MMSTHLKHFVRCSYCNATFSSFLIYCDHAKFTHLISTHGPDVFACRHMHCSFVANREKLLIEHEPKCTWKYHLDDNGKFIKYNLMKLTTRPNWPTPLHFEVIQRNVSTNIDYILSNLYSAVDGNARKYHLFTDTELNINDDNNTSPKNLLTIYSRSHSSPASRNLILLHDFKCAHNGICDARKGWKT